MAAQAKTSCWNASPAVAPAPPIDLRELTQTCCPLQAPRCVPEHSARTGHQQSQGVIATNGDARTGRTCHRAATGITEGSRVADGASAASTTYPAPSPAAPYDCRCLEKASGNARCVGRAEYGVENGTESPVAGAWVNIHDVPSRSAAGTPNTAPSQGNVRKDNLRAGLLRKGHF
jgi:hypothetical protein